MKKYLWLAYLSIILSFVGVKLREVYGKDFIHAMDVTSHLFQPAPPGGAAQFMYREDPQRTNSAEKILRGEPRIAWTSEKINYGIHTASKASPAVDQDGIFVPSDEGWFYAFSHDKKLLWKWQFPGAIRGLHSTPATDQRYVYFGTYEGGFYCLRKKDGSLIWKAVLGDAVGSSPLIAGDFIYVGAEYNQPHEGHLVKINKNTGEIVWTTLLFGEQTHSSPALSPDGENVYIGDNAGRMMVFSARDGHFIHALKLGGPMKSAALISEGEMYFGSWGEKIFAVSVPLDRVDWEAHVDGLIQSAPVLDKNSGLLFVNQSVPNALVALNSRNGDLRWKRAFEEGRFGISSPSIIQVRKSQRTQSLIAVACARKRLCFFSLEDGKELYRLDLPGDFTGTLSYYDGALYAALDEGPLIEIK